MDDSDFQVTISYLNSADDAIVRKDDFPVEYFGADAAPSYLFLGPADVEAGDTVQISHVTGRFGEAVSDEHTSPYYKHLFQLILQNKQMPENMRKSREELELLAEDKVKREGGSGSTSEFEEMWRSVVRDVDVNEGSSSGSGDRSKVYSGDASVMSEIAQKYD